MTYSVKKSNDIAAVTLLVVIVLLNLCGMIDQVVYFLDPQWTIDTLVRAVLALSVFLTIWVFISRMAFRKETGKVYPEGFTKLREPLMPVTVSLVFFYTFIPGFFHQWLLVEIFWPIRLLATGVFILGFGLRVWAQIVLGSEWSEKFRLRSNHRIVKEGPYQYVRHPIYLSYVPIALGLFGMTGDWLLGFCASLYALLSLVRASKEEQMLRKLDGFDEYAEETPAGVPLGKDYLRIVRVKVELQKRRRLAELEKEMYGCVMCETTVEIARLKYELARLEGKDDE